jgi:hypothetical protein
MQFLEQGNAHRQSPDGCRCLAPFTMQVDAKAPHPGHAVGGIRDLFLSVLAQGARNQCGQDGRFDFGAGQRVRSDWLDFPLVANGGGGARDEQQIAATLCHQGRQPFVQTLSTFGSWPVLFGHGAAIESRFVHLFLTRADNS